MDMKPRHLLRLLIELIELFPSCSRLSLKYKRSAKAIQTSVIAIETFRTRIMLVPRLDRCWLLVDVNECFGFWPLTDYGLLSKI